jgi:hypothetical protein
MSEHGGIMLMQRQLLCVAAAMVTIGCSAVLAQQSSPPPEPQQQKQLEDWQRTESGKMGKEEPGSHAETPKPAPTAAFVNGALSAGGAPADVDTVPAKFSEKNARDDQLIILAYTFKNLSSDQTREIAQALKDQGGTTSFNGEIGTVVPFSIELRPVPDTVVDRVPQTKGYEYLKAGNRVMLVSPPTRIVVAMFSES